MNYRCLLIIIQANFKATRYDTLRIGIAILNDWNSDTCIGNYLKDVYANRVSKGSNNKTDTKNGHS